MSTFDFKMWYVRNFKFTETVPENGVAQNKLILNVIKLLITNKNNLFPNDARRLDKNETERSCDYYKAIPKRFTDFKPKSSLLTLAAEINVGKAVWINISQSSQYYQIQLERENRWEMLLLN